MVFGVAVCRAETQGLIHQQHARRCVRFCKRSGLRSASDYSNATVCLPRNGSQPNRSRRRLHSQQMPPKNLVRKQHSYLIVSQESQALCCARKMCSPTQYPITPENRTTSQQSTSNRTENPTAAVSSIRTKMEGGEKQISRTTW